MHKPTTRVPSHAKLALVQVAQKEQLGETIRARRKTLGFSQKRLAELAHVKEGQTVSRWERGKNEPQDLPAVAKALQWTVAEMMRGIEPLHQKDRHRMDPDGGTQLDRIERSLNAILERFDIKVPDLETAVSEFERETADTAAPTAAPTPPRRGRRAA